MHSTAPCYVARTELNIALLGDAAANSICRRTHLNADRLDRRACFFRGHFRLAFRRALWPDMKSTVTQQPNFPPAPDPPALPVTLVKHIMGPWISFGPVALALALAVLTTDDKPAHVIISLTTDAAVGKGQMHIHPVAVFGSIGVESSPRPGWK